MIPHRELEKNTEEEEKGGKGAQRIHIIIIHSQWFAEYDAKRRNKHSRQNWKNKVERRKLEAKGQTTSNVEEMGLMVPNIDEGAREFDVDFSAVKIRREKVEYSREEEEKLKRLQEESKEIPGSYPFNEVIVEENQTTIAEFSQNENLVLPADEVFKERIITGSNSVQVGRESRTSTYISQEDLEELMTSVKKDPYLRPIIEYIETDGPTVMMSGSRSMRLSTNAKIQRNKHAKENWKNKMERKKLEAKGQTAANVEKMGQTVPNVNEVAQVFQRGPGYRDFSTVKIPPEKIAYSEDKEKLQVIVQENQQTVAEFCKKENLVLPADEVGDESYESRTSTSISQEDLEELMTSVKKDPHLKTILEDIETGGPTVMMRYLNDSEITQKLAQAMGFGILGGDKVCSVEHNAPNADAEDQTAKQA
ncbi:uncharacterized protein LOC113327788 isoform X2 [Papaver somniferum]|uniref:uncharacterized protein LOC113327788 isoform X2 n=1 Tax=Papaver somniferum TaxID=3469 RepID=UPI000E6F4CB0|nr:uncharacterized protein LOC113327788 isoform X2 [Papaver somniferum]